MSSSLKQVVADHVRDHEVAGLVIETEYRPLGGQTAAVAPPTYAPPQGERSKAPVHAVSDNAFVPEKDAEGWYSRIQRNENAPRRATRVALDSVGSQSGRAETALWMSQDRLGVRLPGLIVSGEPGGDGSDDTGKQPIVNAQLDAALDVELTSWTAAHRHIDAWFRYGEQEAGVQVWQDEGPDSVKKLITTTSAATGEQLYSHFPNAAIYGFWLSSGTAARHKLPRAYSSEIIGYGATAVTSGATKLDDTGGTSDKSRVSLQHNALSIGKGGKPSNYGFGQVPSQPVARSYVCELILQQASIALPVLRSLRFENAEVKNAALTVLTLLAMSGHALAAQDGFLRSGCSLVSGTPRWGWMRHGSFAPEPLHIENADEIIAALREAVSDAERLGLVFTDPIRLRFSEPQRALIAERVEAEAGKLELSEE